MNISVKGFMLGCLLTASSIAVACSPATPSTVEGFCESFKAAAECHCTSSGFPKGMCGNIILLYKRMIDTLGTLQRVCEYQHDVSPQECMDDWNCYRYGGLTSDGQLCSGSGHACA